MREEWWEGLGQAGTMSHPVQLSGSPVPGHPWGFGNTAVCFMSQGAALVGREGLLSGGGVCKNALFKEPGWSVKVRGHSTSRSFVCLHVNGCSLWLVLRRVFFAKRSGCWPSSQFPRKGYLQEQLEPPAAWDSSSDFSFFCFVY